MIRIKTPKTKESEVLFLNRHMCCVCHEKNKDVQIHHIDGNSSNNDVNNLAVLCLDCHSKVTGTRGLGKSYSQLELKRYKHEWEKIVKKKYGFPSATRAKPIPKIEKQLFVFEIKRLIYEMLSARDSQQSIFERNFDALWNISILEGLQKEIIEHLSYAFVLSAISQVNKPIALANALPKFFGYLVGPVDVSLRKTDERNILDAIETIEFTHNFCVDQNKNYKLLRALKNSLSEFIQIAILYKNNKIFRMATRILKEIRESTQTIFYENDKKMPKLTKEIDELLLDIEKELKEEKLRWKIKLPKSGEKNV